MNTRLTSATLLRQTFTIYFANFIPFTVIVFTVLFVPLAAQALILIQEGFTPESISVSDLVMMLVSILFAPVATGALTYGVFQAIRNQPVEISECLRIGLNRLIPVLLVGLSMGILVLLGTFLCIIPGFIAVVMLAAAVPAAVIEKTGVRASISRSMELTSGFRWFIFGAHFAIVLLGVVAGVVLGFIQQASLPIWFVLSIVLNIVSTGLSATSGSVIYYNCRRQKEPIDVEEIAAVFD